MLPQLNEIKAQRKQLGLTQTELAGLAHVSQSLVTKIESGKLVPTYEKAKRIFDALASEYEKNAVRAKDMMSLHVYSVSPFDSVKKAVRLMESKAVSQLPVLDKGRPVGRISEKTVLNQLGKASDAVDLAGLSVERVMEESMPVIQEQTPFKLVSELLKHNQAVLIARKGKVKGIIAKSDLLKMILKKK